MSWRLAFHSTKLLFSYIIPYKIKLFRDAIFSGDVAAIRNLAESRPRLLNQSIDADGNTAIGLAILLGEVDVVRTLVELGSDPNIANAFDGNHPLVFLAKLRPEENSKTLLLADILLTAGSNPLHEVRYQADSQTRIDATQTPSFHETPLLCCVRFQNDLLLKKMIEHEVDINSLNPETGTTPLMLAAALGYQQICEILLDAGADVNAADHNGNTPLHLAVEGYGEHTTIIETLLQRGANVNITNDDGFTPAALAQDLHNDACFKLIQAKAATLTHLYEQQDTTKEKEEAKGQNIFSFT